MDPFLGPYVLDWLHLVARWVHVIAAIAWVGTSFYFIALDYSLLPPKDERQGRAQSVGGESWEIHSGGFYRIEKSRVAPPRLPEPLRWFKWEAYTTWLSGFALMILLYYADAGTYLIDRRVADIAPWQAVGASVAILAVSWLIYDALSRLLADRPLPLAGAIVLLVVVVTWLASQIFSARAAYIQVGAAMGTWMAANVFFVIIPGQRKLVAAVRAGREPDPGHGIRGTQRSIHNNYLTLPVLFAMISQHFPFTYGHESGWAVLLALMAVGAAVRHFFNLRHRGRTVWAIPAAALLALLLIAAAIAPAGLRATSPGARTDGVEFASVQLLVTQRCLSCHSMRPTYPGLTAAPRGVTFDTPEQIRAFARRIYEQVVLAKVMPPGNVTGMTPEERDTLARWIEQGAPLR